MDSQNPTNGAKVK